MANGFFNDFQLITNHSTTYLIPRCGACGLFERCKSPKMPIYGEGREGVLIVGESPVAIEDAKGRPFIGKSGEFLRDKLSKIDVNLDKDCWATNSLICRPTTSLGKNYNPTFKEVDYCRPNLISTIQKLQPKTIILLGDKAVYSLIGHVWKEDPGAIGRWVGWRIPLQKYNCWICPTWHPSFILRTDDRGKGVNPVLDKLFLCHLEKAFHLKKVPWKSVPDWHKKIFVELDPQKAASSISNKITSKNIPTAIDYEANVLKPDCKEAAIYSCALSNGEFTISYPWVSDAITATKEFLVSPIPKIAANMKYEDRFTNAVLGVKINNWKFDTMLAAHTLDNRAKVSGLKFQAFVRLGQQSWDDHIKPYFQSKNANSLNRIHQIPLPDLLLYGGLDALLEWKLAMKQSQELGIEWN